MIRTLMAMIFHPTATTLTPAFTRARLSCAMGKTTTATWKLTRGWYSIPITPMQMGTGLAI
jgi:hypothetical protein